MPWKRSRREWMLQSAAATVGWCAATHLTASQDAVQWHDVREWGIEGKGFADTESPFDRLPARAKGVVREPVWNLSRHAAGMSARFRTNATSISIEYRLTGDSLSMPHMPATGVSGVDLYARDPSGRWRWVAVTQPKQRQVEATLVTDLPEMMRDFHLDFPLYNGIEHLRVGVPKEAKFEPIAPRKDPPILFYGTSITQGACASRPGMSHVGLLGKRLDRPILNFGFSGNGKMEWEVGQFLAEIDSALMVIDCLPNMESQEVAERAEGFVTRMRAARPEMPILLVEDRTYANAWLLPARQQRHRTSREALKDAYQRLVDRGIQRLSYLEGESLLGDDGEATTDGSHPSDLGFVRQADAMESSIRALLAAGS
ncbi:MAG: SGNH/GDSL hydrolase family protein [Pirellulaceae bacterium]